MKRLLIFSVPIALVFALFIAVPTAVRADPTCPSGYVYQGTTGSDGSYACSAQTTEDSFDTKYFNAQGTEVGSQASVAGAPAPVSTTGKVPPTTPTCSLLLGYTFEGCIWNPLLTWLGSWFLTIGGGWLRLAGTLLDNLIYSVIVNFKGSLDGLGIMTAVNTGWTIFRDFTNILIIGIFVFIALSIILGLKEFGQKKLIANVLIIAVLINFSLLFSEMVIDGSNFFAFQIYKQMAGTTIAATNAPAFDIAGQFLKPMGITSVWNDTALLTDQVKQQTDSALQAFLYGLIGGVLLLLVAAVLFYGAFLIAARAVLFIFLMLTAALAFATYLVPTLAKGEYGWSSWWKALFNNAVFAPLIMLFLYVSLVVMNAAGEGIKKMPGGGANAADLGAVIANPGAQLTQSSAWGVMLAYALGVGLLFISFRMAHKFAGTISGFSLAGAAVSLPFAGLARGFGAAFGRAPVVGARANMKRSLKLEDQLTDARVTAANTGNYNTVLDIMKKKAAADKAARGNFNPLSSDVSKAIAKATFVPKVLTEAPKKNYAEEANKIAAEAAKTGAAAVLSKSEAEGHVRGEVEKEREAAKSELEQRKATSSELLRAAQQMSNTAKESAGLIRQKADQNRIIAEANKQSVDLNNRKQQKTISDADHQRLMNEQKERILRATEKIQQLDRDAGEIDKQHNLPNLIEMQKTTEQELRNFQNEVTQEVKKRAEELLKKSAKIGEQIAVHEAEHNGDSTVAEIARRKVVGRIKNRPAIEKRKRDKEIDSELEPKTT